jgi:hypothetical protein
MKREGFILTYCDPTESYALPAAVICSGDSVKNLKEVVEHFEERNIVWSKTRTDLFGRNVVIGDVNDDDVDFYDAPSPFYVIYQVKPPKHWKLVK